MSYQGHSKKPSLPSIQFLLNEEFNTDNNQIPHSIPSTSVRTHNKSNSISTLPSELQQLSLSAPINKTEINQEKPPSWMLLSPSQPIINKKPTISHGRSHSDLTLIKPIAITPTVVNDKHIKKHRRTVSANVMTNTIDFFKTNKNYSFIHQPEPEERANTESPPTINDSFNESPQQKLLFDALNIKKETLLDDIEIIRNEETGKYNCPFCNKPFNRPSSLKIHTYSHTGEKPFECPVKGCGRQFSVQSNMRRHLRVHKTGKSKLKLK